MDEIGELFKSTRENSGVTINEASKDLGVKEEILENIEDGNIGCFKDIFELKSLLSNYAKYLGLDEVKTIDKFNEYMFNYTSKIPIKEIEKKISEQNNKKNEDIISSPYTKEASKKENRYLFILLYICIILVVIIIIVWSVREITINRVVSNTISYVR